MKKSKDYGYVADFETTSTKNYEIEKEVRVWGCQVRNIETNKIELTSNNIDEFFKWIEKKTTKIFFHNLRFDGQFIIEELFKRGFRYDEKSKSKCFKTLINGMGVWYGMTIYHKVHEHKTVKTEILDSYKKLPFGVDRIAQAFKLEKTKLVIDYEKFREKNYEITEDEERYLGVDTEIIAKALKIQFETGMEKMTVGADAMKNFKDTYGKEKFERVFPILPLNSDKDIRRAYMGGFTYLKPEYSGKIINGFHSFDINSTYPNVMRKEVLPFGIPKAYKGKYKFDKEFPLYIQQISCSFKLKKDYIPTIQAKRVYKNNSAEYLTESVYPTVLLLTNIDLEIFLKHYNVTELTYISGFKFKGVKGLFNEYIDYWYNIKMTSNGAMRELAKLMLNSLYGKFATNPRFENIIPYYNEKKKHVCFYHTGEEFKEPVYTAISCFITAYARKNIIEAVQNNYNNFIYCDTDSIKTLKEPKGLFIDDNELGAFKREPFAERGKFLRAKCYMYEHYKTNNKGEKVLIVEHKIAGLPKQARDGLTIEKFDFGYETNLKLKHTNVSGGVLLMNTPFVIKK